MKLMMFTIYDTKAESYCVPFYFSTTGQCLRAIQDSLHDDKLMYSKHPGDYVLYVLGTFDDENSFIHLDVKGLVCNLSDLVVPTNN